MSDLEFVSSIDNKQIMVIKPDLTSYLKMVVAVKTDDYVIQTTDTIVVVNKATGVLITLPVATGSGKIYAVKSIGAGPVTIEGNSSDTIDNELNQTITQFECAMLVDSQANKWSII